MIAFLLVLILIALTLGPVAAIWSGVIFAVLAIITE